MIDPRSESREEDPGVPEALPRTLDYARRRFGADRVDRLWIFPPHRRGRKESGVVAVSLFFGEGDRRRLVTVAYSAEQSGTTLTVEHAVHEEGEAPFDLLPRVMDGVVRRSGEAHGDPRDVEIGGADELFEALLLEFDSATRVAEAP